MKDPHNELNIAQVMKEKKYTIKELRGLVSVFMDEEYPKEKKTGERGIATVAILTFIYWIIKQEVLKRK